MADRSATEYRIVVSGKFCAIAQMRFLYSPKEASMKGSGMRKLTLGVVWAVLVGAGFGLGLQPLQALPVCNNCACVLVNAWLPVGDVARSLNPDWNLNENYTAMDLATPQNCLTGHPLQSCTGCVSIVTWSDHSALCTGATFTQEVTPVGTATLDESNANQFTCDAEGS
jgi:hypothetical protein